MSSNSGSSPIKQFGKELLGIKSKEEKEKLAKAKALAKQAEEKKKQAQQKQEELERQRKEEEAWKQERDRTHEASIPFKDRIKEAERDPQVVLTRKKTLEEADVTEMDFGAFAGKGKGKQKAKE
jgi:hypothetical protein